MFYTDKSNGQSKGEILSNQNHTSKGPFCICFTVYAPEPPENPENSKNCHLTANKKMLNYVVLFGEGGLPRKANYSIRSINMSFKLLKIGRCAEETQSVSKGRFGSAEPKWCASIRAALAAAAVCVATAPSPSWADKTISANTILTEDTDWSDQGTVTIADGVTIDLNGYALKVAAIDGAGSIVDSAAAALASAGYERLEYIASDGQAQYIDTEDSHNASTIVDMRIQFTAFNAEHQAFYGARTGGGTASQFGGWMHRTSTSATQKHLFRYGYGASSATDYNSPDVTTDMICDVHLVKTDNAR